MFTPLRGKVVLIILALSFVAVMCVGVGAFANQTQDLQPAYRLMDGDKELGVVYWLNYGQLIITDDGALYTCGCEEDAPCNLPSITPTGTPPTDVPPTDIPTEKPNCNRGLGNGAENCDPGNSGGKPGSAGEDNE